MAQDAKQAASFTEAAVAFLAAQNFLDQLHEPWPQTHVPDRNEIFYLLKLQAANMPITMEIHPVERMAHVTEPDN
eukprot:1513181-Amphidinium_carterae.1